MKLQVKRDSEYIDLKRAVIELSNGDRFYINECHLTGGIVLNKCSENDSSICIVPRVSNEVLIK